VTRKELGILAIVILLALAFFVSNAHLELASDDLQWLRGEIPAPTDQYRIIPRLTMAAVGAAFGESAVLALAVTFAFHAANGALLYALARRLLGSRTGAIVAAAVFLVNPVTLQTLTWVACLSYVQGVTAALLSLLAFWRATGERGTARPAWGAAALGTYIVVLFSSHEIFALPAAFLALGWLRGERRAGLVCCAAGGLMAAVVYATVYHFGDYGIGASALASPDFIAAYASSALAAGPALGAGYVLSFVVKPLPVIAAALSGPMRWILAAGAALAGAWLYRRSRDGRLVVCLGAMLAAAALPWSARVYLIPPGVQFDLIYLVGGRTCYWSYAIVALTLGLLVGRVATTARARLALAALGLLAFANGLRIYEPADFQALAIAQGQPVSLPPAWQPFAGDQAAWFVVLAVLVVASGVMLRAMRRETATPEAGSFPGK